MLQQAGDLLGKVIVTCSLPMDDENTKLVIGTSASGAEEFAQKVPQAHVVSAFNTVPSEVLFGVFERRARLVDQAFVYCRDDQHAKKLTAKLIRDSGL